ncbi:hypothetical protein COE80_19475 [Bacillus pseudomycoides]|uniref:phage tail protein n=1 Tax=Bacillus pseudomycoides TaxID=64104 RepID=UPI000BFDBF55|nr:phage tail protein [Bacillus pseudomycoides]PHB23095.1 hypothetical protein COE80_19475 [Bacillus pseudomycoides]PHE37624.1 hypothetical protein COF51_16440 [Bacillus pseudomycoides]
MTELIPPQIHLPQAFPRVLGESPRKSDYVYLTDGTTDWEKTYINWSTWNGYAILRFATKCEITHELNGVYECYIEVPLDHPFIAEVKVGRVLAVQTIPDLVNDSDLFRIYKIEFDGSEVMRIYAQHISYDLNGVIAPNMGTKYFTASEMLYWLQKGTSFPLGYKSPFILRINSALDIKKGAVWGNNATFMDQLLGDKGLLEQVGGELERVRNRVFIYPQGTIGGYSGINKEDELPFRVGQNVNDFQYSIDNSQAVTHIMPYVIYNWEPPQTDTTKSAGSKDVYVNLRYTQDGKPNHAAKPEESVNIVSGLATDFPYVRTIPVDFTELLSTEDYDSVKNVETEDAVRVVLANKLYNRVTQIKNNLQYQMAYNPSVSFEVDVQDIQNTPEFIEAFRDVKDFMRIRLGRRFNVYFPENYPIRSVKMRITKTVYDSISQEFLSFQAKTTFTNGIILPKKFYGY